MRLSMFSFVDATSTSVRPEPVEGLKANGRVMRYESLSRDSAGRAPASTGYLSSTCTMMPVATATSA